MARKTSVKKIKAGLNPFSQRKGLILSPSNQRQRASKEKVLFKVIFHKYEDKFLSNYITKMHFIFFFFAFLTVNKRGFWQKWNFVNLHGPVRVHSCLATGFWHLFLHNRRIRTMYMSNIIFFLLAVDHRKYWAPVDCICIAILMFVHQQKTRRSGKYRWINIHLEDGFHRPWSCNMEVISSAHP